MNTKEYLAAVKAATETGTDYAAAKLLGVDRAVISGWSRGVYLPDALACFTIAKVLHLDPARVVADIERERAERQGLTKKAERWREYIGSAAAVILSVCGLVQPAGEAQAAPLERASHCQSVQRLTDVYIVAPTDRPSLMARATACLQRVATMFARACCMPAFA